jgi:hypothetical protein
MTFLYYIFFFGEERHALKKSKILKLVNKKCHLNTRIRQKYLKYTLKLFTQSLKQFGATEVTFIKSTGKSPILPHFGLL